MKRNDLNKIFNAQGFSLVEILVAITILAFISIAIAVFTDGSISTAIRVTNEDIESLQIETAMSRMEWDVSHQYSPLFFDQQMNPQGMTQEEGELYNQLADHYQNNANFAFLSFNSQPVPIVKKPSKSELIFFTASNRRKIQDAKQSQYAWVKYELQDEREDDESGASNGEKTSMLTRKIIAQNIYSKDEFDWDDVKTQVLMHKITKLIYEFWNPETRKWSENLDTIDNGNHLIRGLRVTINYLDPSNVEIISQRVFRPLFPVFTPEDMYKFLKGTNTNTQGGETGGEAGEGGAQGADE